jgi:hypothetical protein
MVRPADESAPVPGSAPEILARTLAESPSGILSGTLPPKDGKAQRSEFGRTLSFVEGLLRPQYAQQPVFESAEVAALIKYASERGIDTDDHVLTESGKAGSSDTGSTSFRGLPLGDIRVTTDGISAYQISGSGRVSGGPACPNPAAGFWRFPLDERKETAAEQVNAKCKVSKSACECRQ